MADKSPANAATIAVLPLLLIWMAAVLPVYYPNMGGDGLALPQNILAWAVMALTTLIVTFTICLGRTRLSLTPTARLLLLGIAVLALPLLYTRPEWREDALWRCAGLLGGWLFYVACLQLRLNARQRELLLYGLLFAVSIQALLAALQLFAPGWAWVAPDGGRVYAVFQQPNVLGSFIATGLALAQWALFLPAFFVRAQRAPTAGAAVHAVDRLRHRAGVGSVPRRLAGRRRSGLAAVVAALPSATAYRPPCLLRPGAGADAGCDDTAHRFRSGRTNGLSRSLSLQRHAPDHAARHRRHDFRQTAAGLGLRRL